VSVEGTMPKYKVCEACKGKTLCFRCGGRGKIGNWVTDKCPVCKGSKNCPRCKGTGRLRVG